MIPFDTSGTFHPRAGHHELRRLAVRGAAATVSASGLGLLAQVVGTVVLARLLTPADFGVVTMVTTFSLLLVSFGLNGLTEAVIQFEDIDHHTASNLFWLNVGAGLVLAITFATAGPLLGKFYKNSLVANVAAGLAVGIFIASASIIHIALLKRAMRFATTSKNDFIGRLVLTVVPIPLALWGWGYWALIIGIVAQQLSMTVGAWWLCRWVPSLPRRTGKTSIILRFAGKVYGQYTLRYSTQNIDNLLVGWRFNAGVLGFYKKAFDLFALSASQLISPLNNVALATLSRLNNDHVRFRRYLANSLGIIAFVGMAVSGDLSLVGRDVVRLVLGPQWAQSGVIFELFGPGIGVMLLYGIVGWIHLAIGKPERLIRWTLLELVFTVSLFLIALHWGPAGVAAAWSTSYWTLLIPGMWFAGRPIGFGVSDLLAATWRYALAGLASSLAAGAIVRVTHFWGTPATAGAAFDAMVVVSLIFVTIYLGAVILLHWGLAPLRQLSGLAREFGSIKDGQAPSAEAETVGGYK